MKSMMTVIVFLLLSVPIIADDKPNAPTAEDKVEVETTRIKANKELPKVLYVVPWKEMESYKNVDQKLVLHDFFGDLYEPIISANSVNKLSQK
jgi:hypothetical protein